MVEEVIKKLQTHPHAWKIVCQNQEAIVFAWQDYRFTRFSERFNCVMMLKSKYNQININWFGEDPFISQLYLGLIHQHLSNRAKYRVSNSARH